VNCATKILHIAISITFALSALAWAETGETRDNSQLEQTNIIPESYVTSEGAIVDIQRMIEIENFNLFNSGITETHHNASGWLQEVIYAGGTIARYSYVEDNGELVTCQIEIGGILLTIAKGYENPDGSYRIKTSDGYRSLPDSAQAANSYGSDDVYFLIMEETPDDTASEGDETDDDKEPADPIIVVLPGPIGEEALDSASRDPLDHDFIARIKDAMKNLAEDRRAAYDEYTKNTEPYYKKTYTTLKKKSEDLKSEGFDLTKYFKGLASPETTETAKRELIDDAVEYIRVMADEEGREKTVALEFLAIEERYSDEFLKFGGEIYDRKIERILEYINAIIDELLGSRLGLYLDAGKDKIDVLINLPKPTDEE